MSKINSIPKKYTDLVGTTQVFSGHLFSHKKQLAQDEYKIYDIRYGSATVINFEEMKKTGESSYEHPTVEYLVKNSKMKIKQWTKGFPIREVNLKKI